MLKFASLSSISVLHVITFDVVSLLPFPYSIRKRCVTVLSICYDCGCQETPIIVHEGWNKLPRVFNWILLIKVIGTVVMWLIILPMLTNKQQQESSHQPGMFNFLLQRWFLLTISLKNCRALVLTLVERDRNYIVSYFAEEIKIILRSSIKLPLSNFPLTHWVVVDVLQASTELMNTVASLQSFIWLDK